MTFLSPRKIAVRLLACAGVCLLGMTPLLAQTTVALPAAKDTTIFENQLNNGAGGAPGIFSGNNSGAGARRGFISFDLSSIPSTATITSVQLRMYVGMIAGSGGNPDPMGDFFEPTIGLHRMLIDWGEANTGFTTNTGLGGTGQGSAAQANDATWTLRYFGQAGTVWNGGQPNVDYTPNASASLFFPFPEYTLNSEAMWLSTPSLVSDVQGWLDNPASNNGWMLLNTDEDSNQTFRAFYSRNYVTEALRPQLFVTYAIPEPTSIGFALAGVLLIGCYRRLPRR